MNNDLRKKQIRFKNYVQPIAVSSLPIAAIIGLLTGIWRWDVSIGIIVAFMIIAIAFSVRNWFFFSQLSFSELESYEPLVTVMPWLITVWITAFSCVSIVAKGQDWRIRLGVFVFTALLVGIVNVLLPRYRRIEQERMIQVVNTFNLKSRYDKLRKEYYSQIDEPLPDWENDQSLKNLSRDRILELKSLEAQAIYALKDFMKLDTKPLDIRSLMLLLGSLLSALVIEILVQFLLKDGLCPLFNNWQLFKSLCWVPT